MPEQRPRPPLKPAPEIVYEAIAQMEGEYYVPEVNDLRAGTGATACIFQDFDGKYWRVRVEEMKHLNS